MKSRILGVVTGAFALVAFAVPVAAQQSSCVITDTGNASVNSCEINEGSTTYYYCANDATINSTNVQNAESGNVIVVDNTSGGDAESGDASNVNITDIALELNCAVPAVTETTTPVTPTTPQVLAATTKAAPVAALPATGTTTPLEMLVVTTAVLSGAVVLAGLTQRFVRSQW